tara:strand:- start:543 stop:1007 length:465 start_codon:yes stop_codon:yes gene_type:complete
MARPIVYDNVQVSGFVELEKELERLGGIAAKKAVARAALRKAMKPMHAAAVSLAPDDPRTGPPYNLKTSIKIGSSVKVGKGYKKQLRTQGAVEIYMGPTKFGYPQAIMQEFGTVNHAPKAYMRPAWENHSRNAVEIIKKEMWQEIAKKAKKLGV